jgi:hypothetical protein
MRALTDLYGRIVAVLAIATIAAAKPPGRPQPGLLRLNLCVRPTRNRQPATWPRRAARKMLLLARAPRPLSDARAIMSAAEQRRLVCRVSFGSPRTKAHVKQKGGNCYV